MIARSLGFLSDLCVAVTVFGALPLTVVRVIDHLIGPPESTRMAVGYAMLAAGVFGALAVITHLLRRLADERQQH